MRARSLALLAVLALAAGCLGGDGSDVEPSADDGPTEPQDPGSDAPEDGAPDRTEDNGSAGADETSASGEETQTRWTEDERTGRLTHAHTAAPVEESFRVAEGTLELAINVTTEGPTPFVFLYPPGCEQDVHPLAADCNEATCVSDPGTAFANETPEPGQWTVELATCGILPNPTPVGSYVLVVAQRMPT